MKRIGAKISAGLLGASVGPAASWLFGYAFYFFTEDLPYRNEPSAIRSMHTVDGGLAIGLLTYLFLIPAGILIGSWAGLKLYERLMGKAEGVVLMVVNPKGGGAELFFPIIFAAVIFIGLIIGLAIYFLRRMQG
jgi:hypothetical protein